MQSTNPTPYVVTVIPSEPTEATQTTVSDLLLGAFSLASLLLVVALVLGAALGGIRLAIRHYGSSGSDHMPPVRPIEPD